MSDFFGNLAARSVASVPSLRPRIGAVFETPSPDVLPATESRVVREVTEIVRGSTFTAAPTTTFATTTPSPHDVGTGDREADQSSPLPPPHVFAPPAVTLREVVLHEPQPIIERVTEAAGDVPPAALPAATPSRAAQSRAEHEQLMTEPRAEHEQVMTRLREEREQREIHTVRERDVTRELRETRTLRERIATPQSEPVVHVTIGRIEVRAVTTAPPPQPAPRPATPAGPSLEEYLAKRDRRTS